jgi:hypothetical protein
MALKHLLKISMPPLDIQEKNARLTSSYDIFVKDHVQLHYMHQNLNN